MEDRKFRIDGLDLLAHLCGNGGGIELSAKKDGQVFGGVLIHAAVDLRNRRIRQRFRAGIRNHADDRGPGWLGRAQRLARIQAQKDAFAQRVLALPIFAWPVHASRGLVDDRNLGRMLKIVVVEKASAQQRHAQQVEVFGRNDGTFDHGSLIVHRVIDPV